MKLKDGVRRLSFLLTIAFFVVCCGAVLLFNWSALGWKAYSVPTGSMRPGLPPGSLALVHSVPVSSLKVGDVITYVNLQKPGTTVTHRIIKNFKLDGKIPAFQTKGDANPSPDPFTVVGGQVRGKMVWHIPYIGTVLQWSKGWLGLSLLVYVPAFIVMFSAALDMADYLKKFQVYELVEVRWGKRRLSSRKAVAAGLSTLIFVLIFGIIAGPVQALLRSNSVSLINNSITVAPINHCAANIHNHTNVHVVNVNTQSASSGNASSTDNTIGGNAASGAASNSNSTSVDITIKNCAGI